MRRALALTIAAFTWIAAAPAYAADDPAAQAVALDKKKKFADAAPLWEKAFETSKTPKHLLNAARDRQKSADPAHAANDYARFLAAAPATDKKNVATAKKELATLGAKLGRFAIRASGSTKITIDGDPIDLARAEEVYATAGAHKIAATFDTGVGKEDATAIVGQSVPVVIAAPAEGDNPAAPAAGTDPTASTSTTPAPVQKGKGEKFTLPPLAAYIGGGVTVALGAFTIFSAIDTQNQKSKFEKTKTQDNLDDGKSKQMRTNIFLGLTAGFAVLTGVVAVVLVDWKRTDTKLGLGPGSMVLMGTF